MVFSRIEQFILSHSKNINLFVEFENIDDIPNIIEKIKIHNVKIFDVEVTKAKYSENHYPNAIFSLRLPKKTTHTAVLAAIAEVEAVRSIEEL